MATTTTNLGLTKADSTDTTVVRTVINNNLDTLDSRVVDKNTYDANTILAANSDNTPLALSVGASTFLGRKASGNISAMSVAEAVALLNNTLLPWLVDVDVLMTPVSTVGFDTLGIDTSAIYNGKREQSSPTQNDNISFDVVLGAGTWTFELMHIQSTNRGIYTITIGGSSPTSLSGSADTIDGYNGSAVRNKRDTITGIVIPAAGKYRLTLTMATKNASSSGYTGSLQHIQFRRTA